MARIDFVSLGVDALDPSLSFYRQWLGLAAEDVRQGDDQVALTLDDGLTLLLYPRAKIAEAAGGPERKSSSEFILSRIVKDTAELQLVLEAGVAAGGTVTGPPVDGEWGRSAFLLDPEGHLWEIVLFAQ